MLTRLPHLLSFLLGLPLTFPEPFLVKISDALPQVTIFPLTGRRDATCPITAEAAHTGGGGFIIKRGKKLKPLSPQFPLTEPTSVAKCAVQSNKRKLTK